MQPPNPIPAPASSRNATKRRMDSAPTRLDPVPAPAPFDPAALAPCPTALGHPAAGHPVVSTGPPDPVARLPDCMGTRRPAMRMLRPERRRGRRTARSAPRRRAVLRASTRATRRRAIGLSLSANSEREGGKPCQHSTQQAAAIQHLVSPRSRPRQWAGALQPDAAGRAAAATQGGPYCRFPFATPSQAWSLPGRCKELPEQAWRSRGRNVTKRGIVLPPLKHEKRGEGFCPAPVDQISVWIRYRRSNASPPLRRDG